MNDLKYDEWEYLGMNIFEGDFGEPSDVRFPAKIIKPKKEHVCHWSYYYGKKNHKVPIGKPARFEKAIFENKWHTYYICMDCLNKHMDENR